MHPKPTHREDGVRGEEELGLPRGAGGHVDNVRVVDEVDVLAAPRLRFGRILVSKIEVPNMFANMVRSGWTAIESDNATEP